MKLRSTTPASLSFPAKAVLVVVSILVMFAVPIQLASKFVFADQYDNQINALNQQVSQYQSQANALDAKAQTLQTQVNALNAQISAIQAQINISQTKYDQLTTQIAATQKQIDGTKQSLGVILADMYVNGETTPIEMLASSNNISDYLDQQTYQSSIQDKLSSTLKEVQSLQAQLTKQQADVKTVLDQENSQKSQLAGEQAQQQQLLSQTQGQEAQYQQMVASAQAQIQSAAAAQRAYYASLLASGGGGSGVAGSFQYRNWSGNFGCSGGYPYCSAQDSQVDPWGLYNRECVSYVAWALSARFGKQVNNFAGEGNAYEWPSSAPALSGAVRVYNPQPGDAVILPVDGSFAPIGHAMIVESVGSDGWIHVSQFNFYGTGEYSTMDIRNSGVIFLRFPSR